MKTLKVLAWAVTLIFSAAAADVEEKRVMKIVVAGDSSGDRTAFHWTSDDADFDMQGMQLGETHSIVDESGSSVLITRRPKDSSSTLTARRSLFRTSISTGRTWHLWADLTSPLTST